MPRDKLPRSLPRPCPLRSDGKPAPEATAVPAADTAAGTPAIPAITGVPPQTAQIETDLYKIQFSNQGGTVRSWQLKKTKGNDNKPLDLVNTAAGVEYPFSLHFQEQKPLVNVNWTWYKQTVDSDGLGVAYEFSDGHVGVRKVFRFEKTSYLSKVSTEVTLDGKPLPHHDRMARRVR